MPKSLRSPSSAVKEVQSGGVQLPRASPVSLLGQELALQGKDPLSVLGFGVGVEMKNGFTQAVSRLLLGFQSPLSFLINPLLLQKPKLLQDTVLNCISMACLPL